MNTLFRARVPQKLLQETEGVAAELGTTTQAIVRMTFAAVVARRALPFTPGAGDDGLVPWAQRAKQLENFYGPEDDANTR